MKLLLAFLFLVVAAQADYPPKFVNTNSDPRLTVAELLASAEGTRPFTFQWLRNGVPVLGQTAEVIRIMDPRETGAFACVISNSAGSVTTGTVKFANTTVVTAPDVLITRKTK